MIQLQLQLWLCRLTCPCEMLFAQPSAGPLEGKQRAGQPGDTSAWLETWLCLHRPREKPCVLRVCSQRGRKATGWLCSGGLITVLISSAAVPAMRERAATIHSCVQRAGGLREGWEGEAGETSGTGNCRRTAVGQPCSRGLHEPLGFHAKQVSVPAQPLNLFPECYIRSSL